MLVASYDMDESTEVESQLDPGEPSDPGSGVPWGGITTLIGIVLIVVFAVQNTESATIDFLWFSGDFPLAIVILVTAVVSALFTLSSAAFSKRRRRKRRAERAELAQLRDEE